MKISLIPRRGIERIPSIKEIMNVVEFALKLKVLEEFKRLQTLCNISRGKFRVMPYYISDLGFEYIKLLVLFLEILKIWIIDMQQLPEKLLQISCKRKF